MKVFKKSKKILSEPCIECGIRVLVVCDTACGFVLNWFKIAG